MGGGRLREDGRQVERGVRSASGRDEPSGNAEQHQEQRRRVQEALPGVALRHDGNGLAVRGVGGYGGRTCRAFASEGGGHFGSWGAIRPLPPVQGAIGPAEEGERRDDHEGVVHLLRHDQDDAGDDVVGHERYDEGGEQRAHVPARAEGFDAEHLAAVIRRDEHQVDDHVDGREGSRRKAGGKGARDAIGPRYGVPSQRHERGAHHQAGPHRIERGDLRHAREMRELFGEAAQVDGLEKPHPHHGIHQTGPHRLAPRDGGARLIMHEYPQFRNE